MAPSRARLQLAARLAKHRQDKEAALAASAEGNNEEGGSGSNGSSVDDWRQVSDNKDDSSSSSISMAKGLQAAPELTRESDRELRDPFADDEEDEEDGSGSDGEDEGHSGIGGVSGWHRGGWWRGVVGGARGGEKGNDASDANEKFGDGRDDDSDSDNAAGEDADDVMDDEEFGDFAMPEVDAAGRQQGGAPQGETAFFPQSKKKPHAEPNSKDSENTSATTSGVTGIDPAREKVLVKPLPLHPSSSSNKPSASPFGSLWPFSAQGFSMAGKDKEKDGKQSDTPSSSTDEPVELEASEGMLSEDGKKIDRTVEARRRTSIEDPDDDDDDDAAEIIIGRGGL